MKIDESKGGKSGKSVKRQEALLRVPDPVLKKFR
jgi:hypothetical protein